MNAQVIYAQAYIDNTPADPIVSLFPNPSKGNVTVQVDHFEGKLIYKVEIVSTVQTQPPSSSKTGSRCF